MIFTIIGFVLTALISMLLGALLMHIWENKKLRSFEGLLLNRMSPIVQMNERLRNDINATCDTAPLEKSADGTLKDILSLIDKMEKSGTFQIKNL